MKATALRYLEGKAGAQEEAALLAFLQDSEQNMKAFRQWEDEWHTHTAATLTDTRKAWQQVQDAIDRRQYSGGRQDADNPQDSGRHRTAAMKWWLRVAAAVVIMAGCSALWMLSGSRAEHTFTCTAPAGSKSQITLPDGSQVWLNGGSALTYTSRFNSDNRRVSLTGEAYFEVTKHKGKPFTVHTSGYDVTVKGTKFNVSAYSDDPVSATTLMEGKVELSTGKQTVEMSPGQTVQLDKSTGAVSRTASDGQADGWRTGRLVYTDISMEQFARVLGRRYNVQVHIASRQCAGMHISVMLQNNETIDEVMSALSHISGYSVTRNGSHITIQ